MIPTNEHSQQSRSSNAEVTNSQTLPTLTNNVSRCQSAANTWKRNPPILSFVVIEDVETRVWTERGFIFLYGTKMGDVFDYMVDKLFIWEESRSFEVRISPSVLVENDLHISQYIGLFKKGSRPQVLSDWISGGRPWHERWAGKVGNVDRFMKQLIDWWGELLPSDLEKDELGGFVQNPDAHISWDCMRVSGKNGFWLVAAGLCFVGMALGPDGRVACKAWGDCVAEVAWVLGQLMVPTSDPLPPTSMPPAATVLPPASTSTSAKKKPGRRAKALDSEGSRTSIPSKRKRGVKEIVEEVESGPSEDGLRHSKRYVLQGLAMYVC